MDVEIASSPNHKTNKLAGPVVEPSALDLKTDAYTDRTFWYLARIVCL